MTRYPWRYRCPEGHANLKQRLNDNQNSRGVRGWYCRTCGELYRRVTDKVGDREVTA